MAMVDRIFVPSLGPTDWRRVLGNPRLHWKRGRSALEMAVAWESARCDSRGIPAGVREALDKNTELSGASLVLGVPELQVQMPGKGHPSQSDFWALLRREGELMSLACEAKAGEPLDSTVGEWLSGDSRRSGRHARLHGICSGLGIDPGQVKSVRYQLLHRALSAVLMAEQVGASKAIFAIVSFNAQADEPSRAALDAFGELFGCHLGGDSPQQVTVVRGVRLFGAWIALQPASDALIATAV